jgi:hypothetical protein
LAIITTGSPAGSSLAFFKAGSPPNNGPRQPKSDFWTGTQGTNTDWDHSCRAWLERFCQHFAARRHVSGHHGPAGRASNFWEAKVQGTADLATSSQARLAPAAAKRCEKVLHRRQLINNVGACKARDLTLFRGGLPWRSGDSTWAIIMLCIISKEHTHWRIP